MSVPLHPCPGCAASVATPFWACPTCVAGIPVTLLDRMTLAFRIESRAIRWRTYLVAVDDAVRWLTENPRVRNPR